MFNISETNGSYHSKALRIAEQMIRDILCGNYRDRKSLPSEQQLCAVYGASRATIRRVISILIANGALIKEPNKTAQVADIKSFSRSVSDDEQSQISMALAFAGVPDGFVVGVCEGVKDFCRRENCKVQQLASHRGHGDIINMLNHAPELGLDGVIVLPYETAEYRNAIQKLVSKNFPVVCIDRRPSGLSVHSVEVDNAGAVHFAVSTQILRYMRPVYFLGAEPSHETQRNRVNGFRMAMREAGFISNIDNYFLLYPATDENPEYWTRKMEEPPYRKIYEFFKSCSFPVSIFCMCDYVACGVYKAAAELNLRIGEDVMVCSFDDLPLAKRLEPPLSSIEQPRKRIGFEAASLLHKAISGQITDAVNLCIPVELHERASSGKNNNP